MKKLEWSPPSEDKSHKKMINSIKFILSKDKHDNKIHEDRKNNKEEVYNLTTNKSKHQLKEKEEELFHKMMLEEELGKFRSEIEIKYKSSHTNRTYRFPRSNAEEELPIINRRTDCILKYNLVSVIKVRTHSNRIRLLSEISTGVHYKSKNSQSEQKQEFSSASPNQKSHKRYSPIKFYGKIKKFLHESNRSIKKNDSEFKTQEKTKLINTKLESSHIRIESEQKSNAKYYDNWKNNTIDFKSKTYTQRKKERTNLQTQASTGSLTSKLIQIHKILNKNSLNKIKRPIIRPKRNCNTKISADLAQGANTFYAASKIKNMNQDYFKTNKQTIEKALKSFSNKNLLSIKGKVRNKNIKKHSKTLYSQHKLRFSEIIKRSYD